MSSYHLRIARRLKDTVTLLFPQAGYMRRATLSFRGVPFPLADAQKTPDRRAQIWSRQHDGEDDFDQKD
jgi:hypothetical protein